MKRSRTPNYCVIQAGTILSESISVPEYSVIGNDVRIVTKVSGVWSNRDDDVIEY